MQPGSSHSTLWFNVKLQVGQKMNMEHTDCTEDKFYKFYIVNLFCGLTFGILVPCNRKFHS